MKIIINTFLLLLVSAPAWCATVNFVANGDACIDSRRTRMLVTVDINEEEFFDFSPECFDIFDEDFKTESELGCAVRSGMCRKGLKGDKAREHPYREIVVECDDDTLESTKIKCPADRVEITADEDACYDGTWRITIKTDIDGAKRSESYSCMWACTFSSFGRQLDRFVDEHSGLTCTMESKRISDAWLDDKYDINELSLSCEDGSHSSVQILCD